MLKVFSVTCAFFLFAAGSFFAGRAEALQAVIRDFAGTVEVKLPSSDTWESAQRGQTLSGDTTISTGFKSTALIEIGSSLLTVRPLTRLTITELSQNQNTEKVDLNLQTGRLRAEVNPPVETGVDFTVRSSSATASVRGTVFEFDTFRLRVREGTVEFSGGSGSPVLIDAGGSAITGERGGRPVYSPPADPAELRPDPPVASETVRPEQPERTSPLPDMGVTIDLGF